MKPTIIRCSKCGYESNIISDTCIKCGSKMEKICGNCGFANSVEKNYCDQCGSLLVLKVIEEVKDPSPPVKNFSPTGNLEFESFHEAMNRKDASYRQKMSQHDEILKDKANSTLHEKEKLRKFAEELKLKEEEQELKASAVKDKNLWEKKKNYFIVFLVILVILIAFYSFFIPNLPKITLLMTAKKYLTSLRDRNYKSAYEYLTNNSKLACSFTDYLKENEKYYSNLKWEFKDVSIYKINKTGAIIKYLLGENGKWREDYISFVFEHGKWKRPYVWNLFNLIDEAIIKRDYAGALFLSQKLYLIDPVDPRSSGYLCNTEYLMGLYDKAIESCKRTLDLKDLYPVGFSNEEIFWYMFYYADSLRFQAFFEKAIDFYNKLFEFEDLSLKNKCPLLMARADAYVRKGDYDQAKNDMDGAIEVCVSGINKEEALKRWRYINGKAQDEAISLAKRFKLSANSPPLIEIVKSELKDGLVNKKDILSVKDIWSARYLKNDVYEVSVKEVKKFKNGKKEKQERYTLVLNLWTGKAEILAAENKDRLENRQ